MGSAVWLKLLYRRCISKSCACESRGVPSIEEEVREYPDSFRLVFSVLKVKSVKERTGE